MQTKANVGEVPTMEGNCTRGQGGHRFHSRSVNGTCGYRGTKCKKGQHPAYRKKNCKDCTNKNHFVHICGQCQRWRSTSFNHHNGPSQWSGNNYRGKQWGNYGFRGKCGSSPSYMGGHQSWRNIHEVQANNQLQDQFQEQSCNYSYNDYAYDLEPDWMVLQQSYSMNAITVVHDVSYTTKPDSSANCTNVHVKANPNHMANHM